MLAGVVFLTGAAAQRYGLVDQGISKARKIKDVPELVRAMQVQPDRLTIDIKHKHYVALDYKRARSIEAGVLISSTDDFVPATVSRNGAAPIPVKLRLKGDLAEHWNTDKWSFRIVTKGNNAIYGMKQFSVQRPDARDFLNEWFYHTALSRAGLIGLRYDFVDVTVNGQKRGIHAVEEHFEKRLLENNERREGPIIRFNEDLFWMEARDHGFRSGVSGPTVLSGEGGYLSSSVDGFQSNAWLGDEASRAKYVEAVHLLEAFRNGDLPGSAVFDVPKMAKFLALSDVLRAQHATRWRNIRYYYNPVSSRLEPIGFDGTQIWEKFRSITPLMNWYYKSGNFYDLDLYNQLFKDRDFYREYLKALDEVSAPGYFEDLLADVRDELDRKELIIKQDYPKFAFSTRPFEESRQYIQSLLNPNTAVHGHLVSQDENSITLDVGNLQFLPVDIVGIARGEQREDFDTPVELDGRLPDKLVDFRKVTLPVGALLTPASTEEDAPEVETKLIYRILGTDRELEVPVFPYPARSDAIASTLMQATPNVEAFDFIEIDRTTRQIYIAPGSWTIDKDLIVPPGYRIIAREGTEITLANGATILSRSPVEFRGTEDQPIVFRGGDGGGAGLVVNEAGGNSVLEHVVFDGLTNPSDPSLTITGAVTFFRSDVAVRNSFFLNNASEDGLNIINSKFEIFGSVFQGTASDALDVDFGQGEIVDTRFFQTGNDGIDVSGSVVTVRNITVDQAGDKAISVGEGSRLSGSNIDIDNSNIGVASKDNSEVKLEVVDIATTNIGIVAYQKKPEYGGGVIEIDRLTTSELGEFDWIEQGSRMAIEGDHFQGTRTNAREVFYPDEV